MTWATCPQCGEDFYRDEPWKTLCLECWKRNQNSGGTVRISAEELDELREELEELRELYRFYESKAATTKQAETEMEIKSRVKELIFFCHPDKHAGSERATAITQWLVGLMGGAG